MGWSLGGKKLRSSSGVNGVKVPAPSARTQIRLELLELEQSSTVAQESGLVVVR